MSFRQKKVGDDTVLSNIILNIKRNIKTITKATLIVAFIMVIFYFSGFMIKTGKNIVSSISFGAVKVASATLGENLEKDEMGNINAIIVGHGNDYLADAIIVASYDPKNSSVSLLSIPRDLYVRSEKYGYAGKINALFAHEYLDNKNKTEAINALKNKVSDITGLDIQYHAIISFSGFKKLINSVGGITVNVENTIVDPKYPTKNGGYKTFKIKKGEQKLNGEKALKYARSRKTTSDFSRSRRQQKIIQAFLDKLLTIKSMTNISDIYAKFNNMLTTNVSYQQILGLVPDIENLKHFFSSVYTARCDDSNYSTTKKGCFLYFPEREQFGGRSVILPKNATNSNVGQYKKTQNYAYFILNNQEFLIENASIKVLNGISNDKLDEEYGYAYPMANKIASLLKKYGFNIKDIGNYENNKGKRDSEKTILKIKKGSDSNVTVQLLKILIPIDKEIYTDNQKHDIKLIIGESYLNSIK